MSSTKHKAQASKYEGGAAARILLVEDNLVNRDVIARLLETRGLGVHTAENGRIGADLAASGEYDLVLMDVQMPEMDGLQATREIRRNLELAELPVIAMSANSDSRDRQACLDAGMDDFLPKPVTPDSLLAMLSGWLPQGAFTSATNGPQDLDDALLASLTPLEAVPGIDIRQGLRNMGGDAGTYLALLRRFVAGFQQESAVFSRTLCSGDFAAAGALVHSLKGAAGSLALNGQQQLATQLDNCLRSGGCEALDELADQLDRSVQLLGEALEGLTLPIALGSGASGTGGAQRVLQELLNLLAQDDASLNEVFTVNEATLQQALPQQVGQLGDLVRGFDYPAALNLVRQLLSDAGESAAGTLETSGFDPSALLGVVGPDPVLQQDTLRKFLEQAGAVSRAVHEAWDAKDAEQVARQSHMLKSSARLVGATEVSRHCADLEAAGKAGAWQEIEVLMTGLDNGLDRIRDYLDPLLNASGRRS